jgi:hypothetical protein
MEEARTVEQCNRAGFAHLRPIRRCLCGAHHRMDTLYTYSVMQLDRCVNLDVERVDGCSTGRSAGFRSLEDLIYI